MLSRHQIPQAFARARAAQTKGDLAAARSQYALILAAAPDLAEVHFNLAQIAHSEGNRAAAYNAFSKAAQSKPKEPAIWEAWIEAALGDDTELAAIRKSLGASGLPGKLKKSLDQAAKSNASGALTTQIAQLFAKQEYARVEVLISQCETKGEIPAEIFYWKGRLAMIQKDDQAVTWLEKALSAGLETGELHHARGLAYAMARRDQQALTAFDAALALEPARPDFHAARAEQLQNLGQFDAARDAFRDALDHEPDNGSLYMRYVSTGPVPQDDPIRARLKQAYDRTKDRHMAYALSKITPPKQSFAYVSEGNAQTRRLFGYSIEADLKEASRIRQNFTEAVRARWSAVADARARPIFVTGLPRSGTTLVEQIIAAHSEVASGGELALAGKLLDQLPKPPSHEALCARYWDVLSTRFPDAKAVTDKSISSYVYIGYLIALFPNARIIVVRRDPRDNALSLFKNKFRDRTHRFTTDLRDIAKFTRLHEAQVAFWRNACPDAFCEVRYEDLIQDPEPVSRKLVHDAGLQWEDACLSFYKSGERVDTLSNVQVRQPIYSSSIGAWKQVAEEMQPFLEAYGDVEE